VSLTSIISTDDHPAGLWLRSTFHRTNALRTSYVSELPHQRVHRPVAPGRLVVRHDVLGTAIDFRIRCAFTTVQPAPSATAGVLKSRVIAGNEIFALGSQLVDAFRDHLAREGPHERGARWLLDSEAEIHLDRMCFSLAWFDRVYRDGSIGAGSPLAETAVDVDVASLLSRVPEYAIRDLQAQVLIAERALGPLRDSTTAAQCLAAPTFAGSADVGGADADVLVAGRLLEIKSISKPNVLPDTAIWQLAGYLLLDYDDAHTVEEVGFYMTRIGWLKLWAVHDFLHLLGARAPLNRLRSEFARVATRTTGDR
jgi:hypothetical protein